MRTAISAVAGASTSTSQVWSGGESAVIANRAVVGPVAISRVFPCGTPMRRSDLVASSPLEVVPGAEFSAGAALAVTSSRPNDKQAANRQDPMTVHPRDTHEKRGEVREPIRFA